MPKRPEIAEKDIVEIVGADVEMSIAYDATLFGSASNNGQMLNEINPKHETVGTLTDLNDILVRKSGALKKRRGAAKGMNVKDIFSGLRGKLSKKKKTEE